MSIETEPLPTPESIAAFVKQHTRRAKGAPAAMMMMHHEGGQEIVRDDDYKGHHVVVRTTYTIEVDGRPVTGHVMLTNDGQVQYHGLPAMSFDSPILLVRALIDQFPQDFEGQGGSTGGHEGGHHMAMAGPGASRAKPAPTVKKAAAKAKPKRPAARRRSR